MKLPAKETTALGVPGLTLRPNTEGPNTITEGTNRLIEPKPSASGRAVKTDNERRHRIPELWDVSAVRRIAGDLEELLRGGSLEDRRNP